MNNRCNIILTYGVLDLLSLADVRCDERHSSGNQPATAGREVVHNDGPIALFFERQDGVRADVACATSDQHVHCIVDPVVAQEALSRLSISHDCRR